MRIDTSEPSLIRLFEKGQVGLIRTEFMRKDDVIASLAAENERLRKRVADLLKQVSAVRNLTDEERSDAR